MSHWVLIAIAAVSNVALNLCLKKGGQGLDVSSPWTIVQSILVSGWMWLAVLSACLLLTAFVAAIRVYSLSLTYTAVTAIAMVMLTVIGVLMQNESVNATRVAGLGLIIAGLALTALADRPS
jgi:multidrug transporter EmrE-like cation transporter